MGPLQIKVSGSYEVSAESENFISWMRYEPMTTPVITQTLVTPREAECQLHILCLGQGANWLAPGFQLKGAWSLGRTVGTGYMSSGPFLAKRAGFSDG